MPNDIGKIIHATQTLDELKSSINKLSVEEKHNLLKNHFKPRPDYTFPLRYIHGCNRSFKLKYLEQHPWMVYSPYLDAAFCISCAVMLPQVSRQNKGAFVNKPFISFHKMSEKANDHQNNQYHCDSVAAANQLIQAIEQPEHNVNVLTDKAISSNITRNRHIVKSIAEAILFCGRQCIALRGDNEQLRGDEDQLTTGSGNPGNFLAALSMVAKHDQVLNEHMQNIGISNQNAKYTSPQVQNKLFRSLGN